MYRRRHSAPGPRRDAEWASGATGRASNRTTARRGLHPSLPACKPRGLPISSGAATRAGAALGLHFRQAPGAAWTRARP